MSNSTTEQPAGYQPTWPMPRRAKIVASNNLLCSNEFFPASLYGKVYLNPTARVLITQSLTGLEVLTNASPEQREWLWLLSEARNQWDVLNPKEQELLTVEPLSRVPLSCIPAMLWLHKEAPASYQWILDNLDTAGLGSSRCTVLEAMIQLGKARLPPGVPGFYGDAHRRATLIGVCLMLNTLQSQQQVSSARKIAN